MRRGLGVVAIVVACGGAAAGTLEELFEKGNHFYEDGRFREAAESYRKILQHPVRDARVEYNLGNAEFKLGHLGRAVLHYRRALRLDPTDADARANLELALSQCADRIEEPAVPAPFRWLRDLQDRIGPDRQAQVALVLLWGIVGIVTWCSARPGGWRAGWGWVLAALAVALALTALSWSVTWERLEGRPLAVVLEPAVEVRAGPGENNAALFTVHEGLTLEVRGERGAWIQGSLPNGLNGWLPRDAVGPV